MIRDGGPNACRVQTLEYNGQAPLEEATSTRPCLESTDKCPHRSIRIVFPLFRQLEHGRRTCIDAVTHKISYVFESKRGLEEQKELFDIASRVDTPLVVFRNEPKRPMS
jgi:hypothetical protein